MSKTFWAADCQRRVAGERDAGFQVDDVPAVQQRRVGAADEPCVEMVDPGAVAMQAAEQAHPPDALVDGGVPAISWHAPLQAAHVAGGEQLRLFRHFGVGVVHGEAEHRVAAQRRRGVGGDKIDALVPAGEVIDEEAEEFERAGRGDPFRQQDCALGVVQREGLRQREAVVDVDAEVVGGERERAGIHDQPGGRVD